MAFDQQLDSKILSRLEVAISKSQYVGQGKKLKVINKVRHPFNTRVFFRMGISGC